MSQSRHALARTLVVVPVAALGMLVAACAQSGAASPGASPTASPAAGTIAVKASEYRFDPSAITTRAGATTFAVTNAGSLEHEFEIFKGDEVVDEVEGLVPGITRELTVTLAAGDYTFACKLAGHEEAGMKGTLTVTQ